jgi:hypothetical protein
MQSSTYLLFLMIAVQSLILHSMERDVQDNGYINKLKIQRDFALKGALLYAVMGIGCRLTSGTEKPCSDAYECSKTLFPLYAFTTAGACAFYAASRQCFIWKNS